MSPRWDGLARQREVLLTLIVASFFGALLFSALNWQRGLMLPALIELAFAIYCVIAFPVVRRSRHLRGWSLAIVLPWILAFLVIAAQPDASSSVFAWVLVLPLLMYFLLGERLGLVLSLLTLAGTTGVVVYRFGWQVDADTLAFAANFALAAIIVVALAHVYERGRSTRERQLHAIAGTDALTGLNNRNRLPEDFAALRRQARLNKQALAILLIDIDRFKLINDAHGHAAGDEVLRSVAELFRSRLRGRDTVYRMGGEEFLVLLPETRLEQATTLAEALRHELSELTPVYQNQTLDLTVSIGVAAFGEDGRDLDSLLRAADRRLYWCKANGRNRVRSIN
ncbi:MAG: diguanylate cyclase [Wenzhouxiangella sp.]